MNLHTMCAHILFMKEKVLALVVFVIFCPMAGVGVTLHESLVVYSD